MGPRVYRGRFSASMPDEFVVFLIGMRFNRPLRVDKWFPVLIAMPRMLRWLDKHPQQGLLKWHFTLIHGPAIVQYWRSFDDLERYARAADAEHLPAWRRFNQLVRDSGDVGIWHETYKVRAGDYEAIYGNMPRVGLGAAGEHRPLGSASTAARRVGERPDDRAPVQSY